MVVTMVLEIICATIEVVGINTILLGTNVIENVTTSITILKEMMLRERRAKRERKINIDSSPSQFSTDLSQ